MLEEFFKFDSVWKVFIMICVFVCGAISLSGIINDNDDIDNKK